MGVVVVRVADLRMLVRLAIGVATCGRFQPVTRREALEAALRADPAAAERISESLDYLRRTGEAELPDMEEERVS